MFKNREDQLEAALRGARSLLKEVIESDMVVPCKPSEYELKDEVEKGIEAIDEVLAVVPNGKARDIEGKPWEGSKYNKRTVKE